MQLTPSAIDWILIFSYIVLVLYVGFYTAKKRKSGEGKEDFILAGRRLTTPLFVATLVATWYGNILGVGEFVYNYGIVAWFCFGIVYYFAAILYAFFVAGKIRESKNLSIPEKIRENYGKTAGNISSMIVLIITIPAAYMLMLGIMIQLFTGWSLWLSIIIGTSISLVYLYKGGFLSDVLTNAVQFVVMYVGFIVLLIFSVIHFGSIGDMFSALPENHTKVFGGFGWMYIVAWIFIAFQTFVDPSFYQRCAAAKSPSVAKRGILISVSLWLLFDIITLLTGLYARVHFADIDPVLAYPALSEAVLPVFWKGIFIIALLSTIMSTLDSYAFLSAVTIGNDLLKPLINSKSTKTLTKIGLVLTGIFGVLLAILLPSPIEIIFKTASVAVPGLILPLIFAYSKKFYLKKEIIVWLMVFSSITSFVWIIIRSYRLYNHMLFEIEPMLAGIIVSMIFAAIGFRRIKS